METKKRINKKMALTKRECQLIESIAGGFNDYETGERLGLGTQTIRVLVNVILKKTETNNRPQLIYWAVKNGVI